MVATELGSGDPLPAQLTLNPLVPDGCPLLLQHRLPLAMRGSVGKVRAFADPLHLGRWWRDAPDVFFGRLHGLSPARRHYFARWLERDEAQ